MYQTITQSNSWSFFLNLTFSGLIFDSSFTQWFWTFSYVSLTCRPFTCKWFFFNITPTIENKINNRFKVESFKYHRWILRLVLYWSTIPTVRIGIGHNQWFDRDCPNPSLNIKTKTMNLAVSVSRPRLWILKSQSQDQDQEYWSQCWDWHQDKDWMQIICDDSWSNQRPTMELSH